MKWYDNLKIGWTWLFSWTGYNAMKLTLTRIDATDQGLFGHLVTDSGGFNCVTLERHDIAVPCGTYRVTLYESPVHGLVPLLHDVPGRTMIEMHEGNWEKDSLGCILVGECRDKFDKGMIDTSKKTLAQLVALLKGVQDIWLTIQ